MRESGMPWGSTITCTLATSIKNDLRSAGYSGGTCFTISGAAGGSCALKAPGSNRASSEQGKKEPGFIGPYYSGAIGRVKALFQEGLEGERWASDGEAEHS